MPRRRTAQNRNGRQYRLPDNSIFTTSLTFLVFAERLGHGKWSAPLLLWFGLCAGLFGIRVLGRTPAVRLLFDWPTGRSALAAVVEYVIAVPALLLGEELYSGRWTQERATTAGARRGDDHRDAFQNPFCSSIPTSCGLEVAVGYASMRIFCNFLTTDGRRLGVWVADVAGHAVPAALGASMIKVALAVQAEPARGSVGWNIPMHRQARGPFTAAAFLYLVARAECFPIRCMRLPAGRPGRATGRWCAPAAFGRRRTGHS
jgi:hypothetical protein